MGERGERVVKSGSVAFRPHVLYLVNCQVSVSKVTQLVKIMLPLLHYSLSLH